MRISLQNRPIGPSRNSNPISAFFLHPNKAVQGGTRLHVPSKVRESSRFSSGSRALLTEINLVDEHGAPSVHYPNYKNIETLGMRPVDRIHALLSLPGWFAIYGLMRREILQKIPLGLSVFASVPQRTRRICFALRGQSSRNPIRLSLPYQPANESRGDSFPNSVHGKPHVECSAAPQFRLERQRSSMPVDNN